MKLSPYILSKHLGRGGVSICVFSLRTNRANKMKLSPHILSKHLAGVGSASVFYLLQNRFLRASIRECMEDPHFRYCDSRFRFIVEKSFEKQIGLLGFDNKPTNKVRVTYDAQAKFVISAFPIL